MNPPDYSLPNLEPQAPTPDPLPKHHHLNNPLSVMQPGEQTICEIKRHPIGLLGIYGMSGALLVVLAVLAFIIVPDSVNSNSGASSSLKLGLALLFILITAVVLIFVYISNKVYWGNSWVVTSDSLTQMTQTSLFRRQSSQLSLGNLEDVTSERNGVFAQLFNFGVLRAETAGERSKFVFAFCPSPDYYAQKILAAREQFEQVHHGGKQEPTYYKQPKESQSQPQSQETQFAQQSQASMQGATVSTAVSSQPLEPAMSPMTPQPPTPQPSPPPYSDPSSDPSATATIPQPMPTSDYAQPQTPQSQPAYDPGAYRPLYPDTPPSFNRDDSEPGIPQQ